MLVLFNNFLLWMTQHRAYLLSFFGLSGVGYFGGVNSDCRVAAEVSWIM